MRIGIKKKVLIVQEVIPHYRIPVFDRLGEIYDLTVTTTKEFKQSVNFNVAPIKMSRIGPFIISHETSVLIYEADLIIYSFNIRYLSLLMTLLFKRKRPLLLWGIGVSSEQGFNVHRKFDLIRYAYTKMANAVIFYSDVVRIKYIEKGKIDSDKLFVANNTLDLVASRSDEDKKYFIFVGTFKKYKRTEDVIQLFCRAYKKYVDLAPLIMIGGGDDFEISKARVKELGLDQKITFTGEITNEEKLTVYYRQAIASVSPYQAGLSVLQSMAKGVPFVCLDNAITGGERFNITNEVNGILSLSEESLIDSLHELTTDMQYQEKLSRNAYTHFKENCSLDRMVNGFVDAINYVL